MILQRRLSNTPFAVIDLETTGLSPRRDRIVELAVVVVRGNEEPRLVLDTLLNPGTQMGQTEVHGLSQEDVSTAPWFVDIADDLVAALANRVLVSHNVYFDVGFIRAELLRAGLEFQVPHICTALLPSILNESGRLPLGAACQRFGVQAVPDHSASADALAAARLLVQELRLARKQGVQTFQDLAARGEYAFLDSFVLDTLDPPPRIGTSAKHRPRRGRSAPRPRSALATYLDGVLNAVADLQVSTPEHREVLALRESLDLTPAEVRAVHAKVFDAMLDRFNEDHEIGEAEAALIAELHRALSQLGWAPGEPPE